MNNSRNFTQSQAGLFLAKGTIISVSVVSILTNLDCSAQIIPDTTLGNESSRVTTDVNIKEHGADLIEGGAQRGNSLFHSFAEFDINNGQRVYFANPTGIANIFSRVTGGNASNILGTLGVNGAANLFLLNPKGIIFGSNAQLDIQGSFLATTANSFQFSDGSEFSATNPQAPPLLTMSVPVGVQYGLQQTASITNQGNLVTGKDLTLSAENLDLQGILQAGGDLILQAQDTLTVRDSASNPFIAAAGGNLLAQGNQKVDIFALNHPNSGFFSGGNMVLQSKNTIGGDAHYWAGGNFRIEQLNGNLGNLFSPYDPVIRASGDVSFDSYEGASLHILAGGSVNILGDVDITGVDSTTNSIKETVTLSDGKTNINIDGSTKPTLDIRAGVNFNDIGSPEFTPNLPIGFNGQNLNTTNEPTNANITIEGSIDNTSGSASNSGQILITNQYNPNKLPGNITIEIISTYGDVTVDSRGDITNIGSIDTTISNLFETNRTAGTIRLLANQNILIKNDLLSNVRVYDNVNENFTANGGDIYLNSQKGKIDINADISSKNPTGIAGNVTIQSLGDIRVSKKIEASSKSDYDNYDNYEQKKTNITINSTGGSVYLDGSFLDTANKGSGYPGDIIIDARDQISIINGSKILSNGRYGSIYIGHKYTTPNSFILDNKSEINTDSNGLQITAGDIYIHASNQISILNASNISSKGWLGIISINTGSLSLNQESQINTDGNGSDKAGNIYIHASDKISIINHSNIYSKGNLGYLDITTGSLSLNQKSQINTDSKDSEKAGNIQINARDKISIFNDSKISSQGNLGDITITTHNLLLRHHSKISTTAGTEKTPGNGGSITINAKNGFVATDPTEDSDIIANAFGGQGGKIKITANRVLGFQNRGKLSSAELNKIETNGISDISASSDVVGADGEVAIEALSIDPSHGLVALPTTLVDPSRLIAQGCGSNSSSIAKGQSEFVITGRGGLPPSPDDTLKPGAILPEWVVNNTVKYSNNPENMTVKEMNLRQLSSNTSAPLVEAVGMVRSANGDIVLTTQPTTATLVQSGLSTKVCGAFQGNVRQ